MKLHEKTISELPYHIPWSGSVKHVQLCEELGDRHHEHFITLGDLKEWIMSKIKNCGCTKKNVAYCRSCSDRIIDFEITVEDLHGSKKDTA